MTKKLWCALLALLAPLTACGTTPVGDHPYDIHARNFGMADVDDVVVRSKFFNFRMGGIATPHGSSGVSLLPAPPWPDEITVDWTIPARTQKFSRVVSLPPHPPKTSQEWYIVIIFFDDDVIVKSLDQITRWDPALHGSPFFYGEDIEARIKRHGSREEPAKSN